MSHDPIGPRGPLAQLRTADNFIHATTAALMPLGSSGLVSVPPKYNKLSGESAEYNSVVVDLGLLVVVAGVTVNIASGRKKSDIKSMSTNVH